MKINELLKHELLQLPKVWKTDHESYQESIRRLGCEYLELLESIDETEISGQEKFLGQISKQSLIEGSKVVYQAIVDCIETYLNEGLPHKAYNVFKNSFSSNQYIPHAIQPIFFIETTPIYPRLYRLRKTEKIAKINDLFHVPFESRYKLGSNRYSIPGYPTLYFSNSVFTAYKELDNPDYDNLYVSKFEYYQDPNQSGSLLDLMNCPQFDNLNYIYKYLARWPLIMACNLKIAYPEQPFKPEYIIPQIVLQWVTNNLNIAGKRIIGVCYPSSRIYDFKDQYYGHFCNTAIPVQHSNKKGYCDVLSKMFGLTKPISFNEALRMDIDVSQQGQVKSISLNGAKIEYINTDFGKIEEVLSQYPYNEMFQVKPRYH